MRLFEDGRDRELATFDAPIVGLLRQDDEIVVVHERCAWRIAADGRSTPVVPALSHPLLAVCNDAEDDLWAAVGLPESGAAVGRLRADGTLDAHWRIGESVQGMGFNPHGGVLYATAPGSGALLMLYLGQGAVHRAATVPRRSGRVSGLAFDAQGGIWTAWARAGRWCVACPTVSSTASWVCRYFASPT